MDELAGSRTRERVRARRPRAIAMTLLAAAVAHAAPLAPTAHASETGALTDDLAAWWQFDWTQRFADETGGPSLEIAGVDASFDRVGETGIERALRIGPTTASSVRLADSAAPDHWSAGAAPCTVSVGFVLQSLVPTGTTQSLVARWADDTVGQWRISVVPETGELELVVAAPDGSVHRAAVAGPDVGTLALATIVLAPAGDATIATLRLERGDGVLLGSDAVLVPGGVRAAPNDLTIGRSHESETHAAHALVDVVAGWSRALAPAEQDALVGPGGLQRYAAVAGAVGPMSVTRHVERIAGVFESDVRHIAIGDSFVSGQAWNRVFPAVLRTREWTPLSAVVSGITPSGALIRTSTFAADASGENPRRIDIGNLYRVEYFSGILPLDYYGLPVDHAVELRTHPGLQTPASGRIWTFTTADDEMLDGATGPFARDGDRVRLRLTHRPVANVPQLEAIRFAPGVSPAGAIDLDLTQGTPRQASAIDGSVAVDIDGDASAVGTVFEATEGDVSSNPSRFLDLTGVVAWREDAEGARVPGPSYATLNGPSWRLRDLAQDEEADGGDNGKAYDTAQLTAWLAATTVDAARPVVFWWYVDAEPFSTESTATEARIMIDVADAACAAAGLARPRHVLVMPHAHASGNRTTDGVTLVHEAFRAGYHDVVDDPAYDHVAMISIYDATDGQWFDGRPDAVAWLAANGYDAFEYGVYTGDDAIDLTELTTLFDDAGLHPRDRVSAAFFASFVTDAVPGDTPAPCPADLDANGTVDFFDLLTLLSEWGWCPACDADLNVDGFTDFFDLLLLLSDWGPCDG